MMKNHLHDVETNKRRKPQLENLLAALGKKKNNTLTVQVDVALVQLQGLSQEKDIERIHTPVRRQGYHHLM